MVEWKQMWELTAWDKKFQGVDKFMQSKIIPYTYLLAKDLFALAVPKGDIKLLSTGVQEGWTTEELAGDYLSEGEVVTIPWGKSPGAQNPVLYRGGNSQVQFLSSRLFILILCSCSVDCNNQCDKEGDRTNPSCREISG